MYFGKNLMKMLMEILSDLVLPKGFTSFTVHLITNISIISFHLGNANAAN